MHQHLLFVTALFFVGLSSAAAHNGLSSIYPQQSATPDTTEVREIFNPFEGDIRFPTLPYYSYRSGLGLTSPDSTFRLNIRFRMQNRATLNLRDNNDDNIEAVVRRLRLRFDGFVGDPRFLYAIQLSFAPGDVGTIYDGDNLNVIRDAMFFYRPNNRINIGFGQTKLPGNRQRLNSSGALQLIDRSINNAMFTIDRDYGAYFYLLNEYEDAFSWNIKTAISMGEGRNWTASPGLGLAYTARVEVMPFGNLSGGGMFFEGDVQRETVPKLLVATTVHRNVDAQRARGQTGMVLNENRDLNSVFVDAMFKFQGWAAIWSYMMRTTDDPVTTSAFATPIAVFAGQGTDYQLSYIFPSDFEITTRFSRQKVDNDIRLFAPDRNQYSIGLTKYIWEHALKIQAEITRTEIKRYTISGSENLNDHYIRFQVEIGI